MRDFIHRISSTLFRCGPLLLVAIALLYFVLSFFVHPSADDYLTANEVRDRGFGGMQAYFYQTMVGRFSTMVIVALFEWLAFEHYWVLPVSMLAFFYLAVRRFWGALLPDDIWQRHRVLWPLAFLLIYLAGMPQPASGFYWLCGAVPYLLGALVAFVLFAWLLDQPSPPKDAARLKPTAILLLAFLVPGFVEPLTGTVLVVLAIGAALAHYNRLPSRRLWTLALVASLAGTVLSLASPGNFARGELYTQKQQFGISIAAACRITLVKVVQWMNPLLLAASLAFFPVLYRTADGGRFQLRHAPLLCWIVWPITLSLLVGGSFCHFWATGCAPPARLLNLLYLFFLTAWFLFLTCLAGVLATSSFLSQRRGVRAVLSSDSLRRVGAVLFVCLLIIQPHTLLAVRDIRSRAPRYHRHIENREMLIRAAVARGDTTLKVPPLTAPPRITFFRDIQPDPNDWRNRCYARYWGLRSIAPAAPAP